MEIQESVRETIERAAEQAQDPAVVNEATATPTVEAKPDTPAEKPTPARGEDGKFKKADAEPNLEEPAKKADEPAKPDTPKIPDQKPEGVEGAEGNPSADIEPPSTWTKEAREKVWSSLTPDAKAYVVRREMEMAAGARKLSTEIESVKRDYGDIGKAVETHRSRWALDGHTPSTAINLLVELDALAKRDPRAFLMEAAKRAGVTLQDLTGGDANTPKPNTPSVDELVQRAIAQDREQRESAERANYVDRVLSNTEKYPYIEIVLADLPGYVQQLKRVHPDWSNDQIMDAAYERAVEVHPETSKVVKAERDAKALKEKQERALKASNASGSLKPSGGGSSLPPKGDHGETVADTLRRQFENQGVSV